MKDEGILQGDLVVVREQSTAEDGDIVVALLGEEATVKRFYREPDHIRLQPENEAMEPIPQQRGEGARAGRRTAEDSQVSTVVLDACELRRFPRARNWAGPTRPWRSRRLARRRHCSTPSSSTSGALWSGVSRACAWRAVA